MEFGEKFTLNSKEKLGETAIVKDTLVNWEKPGDRKFAVGNDYKNAGAILH